MNSSTMANASDPLTRQSLPVSLWHMMRRGWYGLSLISQFMVLLTLTMLFISAVSNMAVKNVAAKSLLENSLEVEQAMALSLVLPVVGQAPLSGEMDPGMDSMLRDVITRHLNQRYINKIKLWGVDGRLLFDSDLPNVAPMMLDEGARAALAGETIVTISDADLHENLSDDIGGDLVYEVYMPVLAPDGTLIAVLEAYCSTDLLATRLQSMLQKIDNVRFGVFVMGMLLLSALVFYAQRRIQRQEDQLLRSMRSTETLAARNRELLQQSEDIRRRSAEAHEHLLNHIGAELHDGPIQLLSIAALYRGQADLEGADGPLHDKAQELFQKALQELRNISVGLILPELEGASLREAVGKAVDAVKQDRDIEVALKLPRTDCHLPLPHLVVAYRVVYEALNNAWKHASSAVGKVTLEITDTSFEIQVFNPVTDDELSAETGTVGPSALSHDGVGMIGMQKRVQAIGGTLRVQHAQGGLTVHVSAPIIDAGAPG